MGIIIVGVAKFHNKSVNYRKMLYFSNFLWQMFA